jgi:hypothetical protein
MTGQRRVGLREVWGVVKASALHRPGKPLLAWYGVLLAVGFSVVAASLVVMRC